MDYSKGGTSSYAGFGGGFRPERYRNDDGGGGGSGGFKQPKSSRPVLSAFPLGTWFLSEQETGIHRQVLSLKIRHHLGNTAACWYARNEKDGRIGHYYRAERELTKYELEDLRHESDVFIRSPGEFQRHLDSRVYETSQYADQNQPNSSYGTDFQQSSQGAGYDQRYSDPPQAPDQGSYGAYYQQERGHRHGKGSLNEYKTSGSYYDSAAGYGQPKGSTNGPSSSSTSYGPPQNNLLPATYGPNAQSYVTGRSGPNDSHGRNFSQTSSAAAQYGSSGQYDPGSQFGSSSGQYGPSAGQYGSTYDGSNISSAYPGMVSPSATDNTMPNDSVAGMTGYGSTPGISQRCSICNKKNCICG